MNGIFLERLERNEKSWEILFWERVKRIGRHEKEWKRI